MWAWFEALERRTLLSAWHGGLGELQGPQEAYDAERAGDLVELAPGLGPGAVDWSVVALVAPPVAQVRGLQMDIDDGDVTPRLEDFTDFGDVLVVGGSVTHYFGMRNNGGGTLNLNGTPRVQILGANAGDFTVVTQPGTSLSADQATQFRIRFNPSAAGVRTATVSITNNDNTKSPYDFAIQGTGLFPADVSVRGNRVLIDDGDATPRPDDFTDFGDADVSGGSVTHYFGIRNGGGDPLNLTGTPIVQILGADAGDFTVVTDPAAAVAPGDATLFRIQFDPTASGVRTATVSIASDDPDESPYDFAITGTGIGHPVAQVRGMRVLIDDGDVTPRPDDFTDFGEVDVSGGTVTQYFSIRNAGVDPLNLTGTPTVQILGADAGDFTVVTEPAAQVAPGDATLFRIRFKPSALGVRTATVSIANDDTGADPYDFAITGTGTGVMEPEAQVRGMRVLIDDGDVTPRPEDFTDFGDAQLLTDVVTHYFGIRNVGIAALNLTGPTLVRILGPDAGDFTVITEPASSVAPGDATLFRIRFDPRGLGVRKATVSIATNDSDENPYEFTITGTGTVLAPPGTPTTPATSPRERMPG